MNGPALKLIDGDALDIRPIVANPDAHGIAIIGSGNIVEHAHIPAYRAAGMRIVGIASRDQEHARGLAGRTSIPKVYVDIDELMRDPEVSVVDIAVPPDYQPALAAQAIAAGKNILAQKPLAIAFDAA